MQRSNSFRETVESSSSDEDYGTNSVQLYRSSTFSTRTGATNDLAEDCVERDENAPVLWSISRLSGQPKIITFPHLISHMDDYNDYTIQYEPDRPSDFVTVCEGQQDTVSRATDRLRCLVSNFRSKMDVYPELAEYKETADAPLPVQIFSRLEAELDHANSQVWAIDERRKSLERLEKLDCGNNFDIGVLYRNLQAQRVNIEEKVDRIAQTVDDCYELGSLKWLEDGSDKAIDIKGGFQEGCGKLAKLLINC